MVTYVLRRLIGALVLLFVITAVTFLIFFQLPKFAGTSTDELAARFAGKSPTPDAIAQITEELRLDDPLHVQYGTYMKGVFTGSEFNTGTHIVECPAPCLGFSFRNNTPVLGDLLDRLPVTFSLVVGAAVLWLLTGVTIGVISAIRRGSAIDRAAMSFALAGVSLPIFFTGLLGLTFLVHAWNLLPSVRYVPFFENPFLWAQGLFLPWVALAFLYSAMYARLTRAGMLDVLGEDYIRTARAKGLPEGTVIRKHALRSSLTPVLTVFGLDLGAALGGAVITEKTFSLKGLGDLALTGIVQSDLPVVLGTVMLAALFIVLANLIVDILYGALDPTVRTA